MPRFVILQHDHPHLHWDLMLEVDGSLRTWRLAEPPAPGRTSAAEPLADHRLAYLDYEGPISGERGSVVRWDAGEYEATATTEALVVTLQGQRFRGQARLRRQGEGWVLVS